MSTHIRLFSVACLAGILLLALAPAAGALEVREGRIKLVLHEDLGRFSLYYLADVQSGNYVPLFVDSDPRTSSTTLLVDSRVSRLGESSEFQQTARRTATGAEFTWASRTLQIQQAFTFVTSSGAQLADGVKVTLSVKNQGEASVQLGVRFLLDTYLGESTANHFAADATRQISRETDLAGSSRPSFWSSSRTTDSLGLYVLTSGEGIDTPERVVFANWQRLSDSSWSFQSSSSRTFSNLPYSINDSAVATYYGPRAIPAGATLVVGTLLGGSTSGAFKPGSTEAAATGPKTGSEILTAIASTTGITDPTLAARTDLRVVNDLLRSIDARVPDAATLTEADLRALENAIRELESRVGKYATQSTSAP